MLERNQALRLAVLDAEHVATLLEYLAALADKRGDEPLAAFHRHWRDEIAAARDAVRHAAIALADDPDDAIRPAEGSLLGRAGHGAATALGTVGEAIDGSPVGKAARKVTNESVMQVDADLVHGRGRGHQLPAAVDELVDRVALA